VGAENTSSESLLELARTVALTAGALAKTRRAEGVEVAASKSSLEDIVTDADRETEALIRSMLADARPNDGFLGEESGADVGSSGLTWIVDPIDGTVNYLYGLIGEVFTAASGSGAFLGDKQVRVAPPVDLSQALVGTGFSYTAANRLEQAAVIAQLIGRVRDIRRMGTASLDLCAVASGRLNAYYERGLKPWDHAAGVLIATEAGARVSGLRGVAATSEFTLAAEPGLAAELESLLIGFGV
jgi:myo-inositol-1(or 4)-monophosphatase